MTFARDAAGNPLDPTFNSAIFSGGDPLALRSVFTDKGPIAKPPLTLQSGVTATINGPDTITLTGATLTGAHLGRELSVTGSALNAGRFKVTAILSPTKARVRASFSLPDPSNGTLTWSLIDPRDGQIAEEPGDVVVRINGTPVVPEAVIGLLGQIVLPSQPGAGDDVKIDYHWIANPTVEIRRLNSREFTLNAWGRDRGAATGQSQHAYRYNSVLPVTSDYALTDVQAALAQPTQRDLKYRAYERAYTAVLNDPTLLKLNSPIHKIAYAPLARTVRSTFVSYAGGVLPEADAPNPWVRHGAGTATILGVSTLRVSDVSTGPFPTGQAIFWTRSIDLTFDHVFASTWRMQIGSVPTLQGVFTGVAAGYSDAERAVVVGYLDDGGVKKIGFLKDGSGADPSSLDAWAGGIDGLGNPTGAPVAFDWSILHSYRLFRDKSGVIKLFIDGDVTETLRVTSSELPYLEELDAPFDEIEGVFFGSLSRVALNTSDWTFLRYNILPTNPLQAAPSVFVSYEGTTAPEVASQPWTPIGAAGTESILSSDYLLLDSTSASDFSLDLKGLVGGDFRGFDRLEPLLSVSSDAVLDVDVALRTCTHGISPNAVMAAVDDGALLTQLCFFPDKSVPKLSYGGHSLPTLFSPTPWSTMGTATAEMAGRQLRISDSSITDGRVFYIDDSNALGSEARVVASTHDYVYEFRVKVESYTPDGAGFCGVTGEVYDGLRSVGVMLTEVAGIRYVAFHSDGVVLSSVAYDWFDSQAHTYRLVKSTTGNLVTLFVDAVLVGTHAYSSFTAPGAGTVGIVSFGSSTPASLQARSTALWFYSNVWCVLPSTKKYAGLWKGRDDSTLLGYHLPIKVEGTDASVGGNALSDVTADFVAAGVQAGDYVVVDDGPNRGQYQVISVLTSTVTVNSTFPVQPSRVKYRIPAETDWSTAHRYRVVRDPGGAVSVLLDTNPEPIIRIGYNEMDLPASTSGVPRILSGGVPSVTFGAFDPTNLSQTLWGYVRYGITRSPTEQRIAPHHEVLNQRNVIASPEHLFSGVGHSHTDFWSSSTGIPPQLASDFLRDPSVIAYTLLNEGTPLVPSTQTFEVRRPQVRAVSVSGLNRPEDILNSDRDFILNDGTTRLTLEVPEDVLYSSLQVIETQTGAPNLLAPFGDAMRFSSLQYQKEHCLSYDGSVLPELDSSAPTPWELASDDANHVIRSAFAGVLTYGTDGVGTRTIYRNATPLPDAPSLSTQVKFRLRVLNDPSGGTGDTHVRFGLSAPGFTLSVALVTSPTGERYVLVLDLATGQVIGGQQFNFLDGNFHEYRLVRSPGSGTITVFIDS